MEEYFVFDVDGNFTGEVVATTEESGEVLDELRRVTSLNILDIPSNIVGNTSSIICI